MGRRTSKQQKLDWQRHFTAQQQSGLTKAKYCRLNNLSIDNFNYHYKKSIEQVSISESNPPNADADEFISLIVETPSNDQSSIIELSFQHQEQTLSMKVRWTKVELIDFIAAWRAS